MKNIILIVIAATIIFGALWLSEKRTDALMSVGECVEKTALENRFMGSIEQAWDSFATQCAKEVATSTHQ